MTEVSSQDKNYFLRAFSSLRALLIITLLIVVASVGGYFILGKAEAPEEVVTVGPRPFVQEIAVSGKVKASGSVDMTFEKTGRVAAVYAEVGDKVEEGDVLISLDTASIKAQLYAAEAEVQKRQIERSNQGVILSEITNEQEAKVKTAYQKLLSEGLVALPQYSSQTMSAPTISGLYTGGVEGSYKLRIEREFAGPSNYILYTSKLETAKTGISDTGPTPIGSNGLYVYFPDSLSSYTSTSWFVQIPNTNSSVYGANYNSYQVALQERDRVVEEAQSEVVTRGNGGTIADAALASALAEVDRLRAELKQYSLRAPFSGVVTNLDLEVGDTASLGTPVITVMSADELEIESFVPEINIAHLSVGDPAKVSLDAYGERVLFMAYVESIDPAETVRDGVSTYRVRLRFVQPDERVKSGMTANIVITTDTRPDVRSIPVGAVMYEGEQSFVMVQISPESTERRNIRVGAVSSLGEVEVVSGLRDGELVVIPKR